MSVSIDSSSFATSQIYSLFGTTSSDAGKTSLAGIRSDQDKFHTKISSLGKVVSILEQLQNTLSGIKSSNGSFKDFTQSDESVLKASVGPDAANGSFTITLDQLAKNHLLYSRTFPDKDSTVGTGNLFVQVGDADTVSIQITESRQTLDRIRDSINASEAELSASLLDLDDGFSLVLTSNESGQDNKIAIHISDDDADFLNQGGLSTLSFKEFDNNLKQVADGENGLISVNDDVHTPSSNEVSDVLTDVKLEFKEDAKNSTSILEVEDASSSIIFDRLDEFIAVFNNTLDGIDGLIEQGADLNDDVQINVLRKELDSISTFAYEDTSLRDIGLNIDTSGKLSLNTDQLLYNIENDFSHTTEAINAFAVNFGDTLTSYVDTIIPDQQKLYRTDINTTIDDEVTSTRAKKALYEYNRISAIGSTALF